MWAEKYAYVNQVLLDSYATFIVYTKVWVVNLMIPQGKGCKCSHCGEK
jgi:hypothetical protein